MIITTEMLFENNIREISGMIESTYGHIIQNDFDTNPDKYPDLLTWMELHPLEVGKVFMAHLINYGFTNDDLNK